MVAMTGAVLGTSATCPSSPITPSPTPMLITAVKIGMSAATSVPKAKSSTRSAISRPMISLVPDLISLSAGVPGLAGTTSIPASVSGGEAAAVSCRALSVGETPSTLPSRTTIMPICMLAAMPPIRYGVSTLATLGTRRSSSRAFSTAFLRGFSRSVPSAV